MSLPRFCMCQFGTKMHGNRQNSTAFTLSFLMRKEACILVNSLHQRCNNSRDQHWAESPQCFGMGVQYVLWITFVRFWCDYRRCKKRLNRIRSPFRLSSSGYVHKILKAPVHQLTKPTCYILLSFEHYHSIVLCKLLTY